MKKLPMRKCVICGKKFTPKTANAVVCSDKCRKANKRRVEKLRKAKSEKPKVKKPETDKKKVPLKEKIVLPKKPVAKKTAKVEARKFDTIISVSSKNPFKLAVLSAIICANALTECLSGDKIFAK